MSSQIESTNVITKTTTKKVVSTNADGWTSVKKVQRESKPYTNKFRGPKKDAPKKATEGKDATEVKDATETTEVVEVKVTKQPIVLPPYVPSGGKGYLAALRGTTDATPVKTTEAVAAPNAPKKKAQDAESVVSDSSDESSCPATPRRLSFAENKATPVRTGGAPKVNAPTTKSAPRPKRNDGDRKFTKPTTHSKRTDEENKAHTEYVIALRKAEDDFLRECLPSDKERVSKVAYELEKIRNHSATVHEVSFAKDFAPVTAGGKEVSFSREKFARNKFFLNRLKKEYYSLFPACDWISIRESNRADKPDTLFIRVGTRE